MLFWCTCRLNFEEFKRRWLEKDFPWDDHQGMEAWRRYPNLQIDLQQDPDAGRCV